MTIEKQGTVGRFIPGISLHRKLIIAFLVIAKIPILITSAITTKIGEDSVSQSIKKNTAEQRKTPSGFTANLSERSARQPAPSRESAKPLHPPLSVNQPPGSD